MFIETFVDRILDALPFSKRLGALRNRLSTFADQGAQGLANIAVAALAARHLARDEFASIGIMLGSHYFMVGFHRATVILPYILDQSSTTGVRMSWWRVNFVAVVAIALLLGLASAGIFAFGGPEFTWAARGVGCAAIVSPLLCTADFAKRWLYQAGWGATAAAASVAYLVLAVTWTLTIGAAPGAANAWGASGAWAIAATASILLSWAGGSVRRGSWSEGAAHWRQYRSFSAWQSATHLPFALYNNSAVMLIGAFAGPLAASAFTAARTLATPASSLISAVDSLDKPRAARALASGGVDALKHSIAKTRHLLILLTGGYLLAIAVAAPWILVALMGAKYAEEATAVRILCAAFFLIGLNQPSETLLIVLRALRVLLAIRSLGALSAIGCLWVGTRLGGLEGACWALLATQALNLVLLRLGEILAIRRRASQGQLAPAENPEG